MLKREFSRIDAKRRNVVDPNKRQFGETLWEEQSYPYRLNFYVLPPTAEISLEEFEEYAINRLKGMICEYGLRNLY
jgi:DNA primase large subunit